MPVAVAVDLGAGSGRIAIGELIEGKINFQIIDQISHEAKMANGHLRWDFDALLGLCNRAVLIAKQRKATSLGIDSWGVDHGFLDKNGGLLAHPICYRDNSHMMAFERLAPHRRRLYELTGIQHQPFNTICQLAARQHEDPSFFEGVGDWMILPDLLGYLLTGKRNNELTQASTTQLMGYDLCWSREIFDFIQCPLPGREIRTPGSQVGRLPNGVDLVSVGSHDTASAVVGFGTLSPTDLFLNMGTWSLLGSIIDQPISNEAAETAGFSNERTVDGRIRFLKNIPGFYFINRLHQELEVPISVPDWLRSATEPDQSIHLFDHDFFNPDSMLETCLKRLKRIPKLNEEWAAIALDSLVDAVCTTTVQLSHLTNQTYRRVRVGGGGSQSREFCRRLASRIQLPVIAGPVEATVLGNLAAQFYAQGHFSTWADVDQAVNQSVGQEEYLPG